MRGRARKQLPPVEARNIANDKNDQKALVRSLLSRYPLEYK